MTPFPEGAYRCSECGHGDKLYACAGAIVSGRLLPDQSIEEDAVEQHTLHESSIDCEAHPLPGHVLERWFDGSWTRWEPCTRTALDRLSAMSQYGCKEGRKMIHGTDCGACPACKGEGGRWTPVAVGATA